MRRQVDSVKDQLPGPSLLVGLEVDEPASFGELCLPIAPDAAPIKAPNLNARHTETLKSGWDAIGE